MDVKHFACVISGSLHYKSKVLTDKDQQEISTNCYVNTGDVEAEAEAGSGSGGSGPFSVEAEAEARKFYRFRST